MGDDSSPDLSLKLRRGSSDSRDSFYMDFDKGIDSDLDEIATTSGADHADSTAADKTATPTVLGQGRIDGARCVSPFKTKKIHVFSGKFYILWNKLVFLYSLKIVFVHELGKKLILLLFWL